MVTVDGDAATYQVVSCGLDGSTVFVVGRSERGAVLQAVVGVQGPDDLDGVVTATAVTVGTADSELAASGADSWERRGMTGRPPGLITSARIRGSRIQVGGDFESVDTDGTSTPPTSPGSLLSFALDARCDEGI